MLCSILINLGEEGGGGELKLYKQQAKWTFTINKLKHIHVPFFKPIIIFRENKTGAIKQTVITIYLE